MPAKYLLLAEDLRRDFPRRVRENDLNLPTEARLMSQYQVSRQTVRQALLTLKQEGLIESRQGSGTRLSEAVIRSCLPGTIAILLPYAGGYPFSSILWSVQTVFSDSGYQSQVFSTENQISRERHFLESLLDHPVSGILVQPTRNAFPNPNIDLYQKLQEQGTTILFYGEPYPQLSHLPSVRTDDYFGGYLLTRYLIRQGHQNIAGIFRNDSLDGHQRYLGTACALRDENCPLNDRHFLWYDPGWHASLTEPVSLSQLEPFLQMQLPDCSAVICQNEEIAYMIARELIRHNIQVPGQMEIACFLDNPSQDLLSAPVTAAVPVSENLWSYAAKGLLELLGRNSFSSVPFSWTIRKHAVI